MTKRLAVALVVFILILPSFAKDKKPQFSPLILRATRVTVFYEDSDAQLPDLHAGANYDAREAVEQGLRKWGRFTVMLQTSFTDYPDLMIGIRKGGEMVRPTVAGGSRNERPAVGVSDSSIRLGTRAGRVPARGTGMEMGSSDDIFSVYLGGTARGPLLWRYSGRNALRAPVVLAVQEFRKAIEAAEKAERDAQKAP